MEQPKWTGAHEMPAYGKFKYIVYRKLRLIGLCLGLDVLQPDFRPNLMTITTVLAAILVVLLFATTALFADGDLAVSANSCIRTGLKVDKSCR